MKIFRNIFRATDNFMCIRNCVVYGKNKWNAENYFGNKIEVPSPPKRPLSAYMIFCKENRKNIIKDNPSLSSPEQIKILAEKWGRLSDEMKKPYELSAKENILLYGEEHKKFYENLTEEQKEELARLKAERLELRRITKLKKALRKSGLPKPPSSAYALFVQAEARNKTNVKHPADFIKEVAEIWKSLAEDSRKIYENRAMQDKIRYAEEMKEWHARMLLEGKKSLLKNYEKLKRKGKSLEDEEVISARKATAAKKKSIEPKIKDSKN